MATNRDLPPTHTIKPMDAPPESDKPTTAQLKADIDSGATGDKTEVFDPALSPLGTDEEAAGTPPSRQSIQLARYQERFRLWRRRTRKASATHDKSDPALTAFASFIGIVAVISVGAIWAL